MRTRINIILLICSLLLLINFISCREKNQVVFSFSINYDCDTVIVFNNHNEILLDTIITTNYSTGLACNYLINKDDLTNEFYISINAENHIIHEPISKIRLDIYYLDRIITHEQSSDVRYYASCF